MTMTDLVAKPLPTWEDVMPVVLAALAEREMSTQEIEDRVGDHFQLDEEQRSRLIPSGGQRTVNNRVRWGRYSLLKAGQLARPARGCYLINDAGRALLVSGRPVNDATLREISPAYRAWVDREPTATDAVPSEAPFSEAPASPLTPDERIDEAEQELRASVRAELLERVKAQTPAFFERLVVTLMLAMGYGTSEASVRQRMGHSGDSGIDGIIDIDRLGRDRLYLQAKRYTTGSVQRPELQQFVGALTATAARDGVFVTTSTFSSGVLARQVRCSTRPSEHG
jgi:restriction system protein